MAKKQSNSNKPEEIRLKVTNWNEAVPTMVSRDHGSTGSRKVVTRGIVRSSDETLGNFEESYSAIMLHVIADFLREGYEYRLTDTSGDDAVRFIPMVAKDMNTVYICAETMGSFRAKLNDKRVTPFYRGEEISRHEANDMLEDTKAMDRQYHNKRRNVTPNLVISCPECGAEVRIGKQLQ